MRACMSKRGLLIACCLNESFRDDFFIVDGDGGGSWNSVGSKIDRYWRAGDCSPRSWKKEFK